MAQDIKARGGLIVKIFTINNYAYIYTYVYNEFKMWRTKPDGL